ncbi:MAG: hypothetical protein ACFFCT_09480 [Candidatus Odinarchaeota archaeon]
MNKHNVSKIALLAIMFLLVASVPVSHAFTLSEDDDSTETTTETESTHTETEHEHAIEEHRDNDGTAWIQTDIMTATLSPHMPTYQFWYTSDNNGSLARFMVSFRMIVEFEDTNGDGVYQPNETLAFAPLDAFEWSLQIGAITDASNKVTEVYASYTKGGMSSEWEDDWFEDWMPGLNETDDSSTFLADEGSNDYNFSRFSDMTLRFYGHVYTSDYNGNITDDQGTQGNYTVAGGMELKVDVEIGNFPFISNMSKVAVLNYLREDVASNDDSDHAFELHDDYGEVEVHSEDVSGEHGTHLADQDSDHDGKDDSVQQLSLVDDVTNVTQGLYSWLDKAVMTYLNGSQAAVDVGASYWTDGNGLLLFLAYPNFDGGSITHDPSMRLLETGVPNTGSAGILGVPMETIALIGIAAAIIIVAGFAIKRR